MGKKGLANGHKQPGTSLHEYGNEVFPENQFVPGRGKQRKTVVKLLLKEFLSRN